MDRQVTLAQTVAALGTRADPASIATAALMAGISLPKSDSASPDLAPDRPLELATRASLQAPTSALYAWLRLQLCEASTDCDRASAITALRAIDPDNAAVWFVEWIAARERGDSDAADRAFTRMAMADRFDVYWIPLVVAVNDTLQDAGPLLALQWRPINDIDRFAQAMALSGTVLSLPLRDLTSACDGLSAGALHFQQCLGTARAMQRADTMAVQAVGFGIEQRLTGLDDLERNRLTEQQRLFNWRHTATFGDLGLVSQALSQDVIERVSIMRQHRREEDVNIALLASHHLSPTPPANWTAPPG